MSGRIIDLSIDIEDRISGIAREFRHDFRKYIGSAMKRTGQHMRTAISRKIRETSFLKLRNIREAVKKPYFKHAQDTIIVDVASQQFFADQYKLTPARITSKKRIKSKNWPSAAYKIGPGESAKTVSDSDRQRYGYRGKPFIINASGKKRMVIHRIDSEKLAGVMGPSAQYFASFDGVSDYVLEEGAKVFEQRLEHEIARFWGKFK